MSSEVKERADEERKRVNSRKAGNVAVKYSD